jgi:uncharacterized protein (TIGR03437 family)
MFRGTYFAAALENDTAQEADGSGIDSFYGSSLALGSQDTNIFHQHYDPIGNARYDYTADGGYQFQSDGLYNDDDAYQYQLGVSGKALLMVGIGSLYSLYINLQAQPRQQAGVFIDPLSIFNAASYAPIMNPVAPDEFITIFGNGMATSPTTLPLPTTLGTTQVRVNGQPAPLDYVSPTQINLLVPYATTAEGFATFQVSNNGVLSNEVTVYTRATAPGVFTLTNIDGSTYPAGTGPGAIQHADYSLVTSENPAVAGETLLLYVTGLGAVSPQVADGAAAPSRPPATVNETVFIDILDSTFDDFQATVWFAGMAAGLAGLYQINFIVPSGLATGAGYVDITTNEAYTSEAMIYLQWLPRKS